MLLLLKILLNSIKIKLIIFKYSFGRDLFKITEGGKTYDVKFGSHACQYKSKGLFITVYGPIFKYNGKIHRELGPAIYQYSVFSRNKDLKFYFDNDKQVFVNE